MRRSASRQLDDWLESWLRLLWSPAAGRAQAPPPRLANRAASQLPAAQQQQPLGKAETPLVRWWLLLSLIWLLCCVAQT